LRNCNPERELEWRQGGEFWETRKNSFGIVEAKTPGKGG